MIDRQQTYRDMAFETSVKKGLCEYNLSDVDWLFSIGLPDIKTAVITGSMVRAGALYLSCHCQKLVVIAEDVESMTRLRAIAEEEGLDNVFFELAGEGCSSSLKNSADYIAILEDLEDDAKRLKTLSLASEIISDKGVIGFFLRGNIVQVDEKKELKRLGLRHYETFWAMPSVWRPTWSGKLNEKLSYEIWIDAIDFNNMPSLLSQSAGRVILSKTGKCLLKAAWNILYPFRRYIIKEVCVFAGRDKENFRGNLSHLLQEPFIRKSKASKEGRILFFTLNEHQKLPRVLYLSRLRQYEPLLKSEMARNAYSICPVSQHCLGNGAVLLASDFVPGERIDVHEGMDAGTVSWLIGFQQKTFSGYWNEEEYSSFISKRTFGHSDGLADKLLRLLDKEGRRISIVAEHGDFGYLNILKAGDKRCVLDWEYYNEKGDEFFDMAFFILDMYTESLLKKDIPLRDFVCLSPAKDYISAFMSGKKIKNVDIMLIAVTMAATRVKYQSLFYAAVKDSRYWMFDGILERLMKEVAAI